MNKNFRKYWVVFAFTSFFAFQLSAQPEIELELFASGFSSPVDIANAGDDRLFIVEKRGVIKIINAQGITESTPFLDIQNVVNNNGSERGLLGLEFSPDYANNGLFYVNYTEAGGGTVVASYQVSDNDPDVADASSATEIISVDQDFGNHNGGDIAFGPDGYLYIGMGDGGSGGDPNDRSQDPQQLLGKMLRIDVNNGDPYSIPADNPFVNVSSTLDEIWTLGLRNPWRWSFDRLTGDMWIADVGQGKVEEVSFEPAGSAGGFNYGWRCYEGDDEFNLANCVSASQLTEPVFTYRHNSEGGLSITGGYVYRGSTYPLLQGHYVFGDYASGRFWTTEKVDDEFVTTVQGVLMGSGQLSTFGEDSSGELYAAAYNVGSIFKVTEKNLATSIDGALEANVSIFPNPTSGKFVISFENATRDAYDLKLLDMNGRLVYELPEVKDERLEISLPELSQGVYLVRMEGEKVLTGKLLITK